MRMNTDTAVALVIQVLCGSPPLFVGGFLGFFYPQRRFWPEFYSFSAPGLGEKLRAVVAFKLSR